MSKNEENYAKPEIHESEKQKQKSQLKSRHNDDTKNPCLQEQKLSYKCLSDNNYDRDICLSVFQNYKNCTEFWTKVRRDRRSKGITPELPLPEHRQEIKEKYLKDNNF